MYGEEAWEQELIERHEDRKYENYEEESAEWSEVELC